MSEQVVYVIGHRPTEPAWKNRGLPIVSEPRTADYHKIGIGQNPDKRVGSLSVGTPHELELVTTIESSEPKTVESELHRQFSFGRQSGEWFKLTSNQVNSLVALKHIEPGEVQSLAKPIDRLSSLYIEIMRSRVGGSDE